MPKYEGIVVFRYRYGFTIEAESEDNAADQMEVLAEKLVVDQPPEGLDYLTGGWDDFETIEEEGGE